jgi:hypothetical protein
LTALEPTKQEQSQIMGKKAKKCVLGNDVSRDSNSQGAFASSRCTKEGVTCMRCGCFSCEKCVRKVLAALKEDAPAGAYANDEIVKATEGSLVSGEKLPKCHACWIGDAYRNSQRTRVRYRNLCSENMTGDGYLILEQFGVAFDAPMAHDGVVDVHGLGEDVENGLPAVRHLVLSAKAAVDIHKQKVEQVNFPQYGSALENIHRSNPTNIGVTNYLNYRTKNNVSDIDDTELAP